MEKSLFFPEFSYDDGKDINVHCPAGYVRWANLHGIHDKNKELAAYLRMSKLAYQAYTLGSKSKIFLLFGGWKAMKS